MLHFLSCFLNFVVPLLCILNYNICSFYIIFIQVASTSNILAPSSHENKDP
jgi:hypothetical protein